jgi:hypothetical protein
LAKSYGSILKCYLFLGVAVFVGQSAAAVPPLEESPVSRIEYPSVAAALSALRVKPGVQVQDQGGWIIITEREANPPVLWSFSPPRDPSYPSVVKRAIVQRHGQPGVDMVMDVHCEADKASCDNLVREFQVLNQRAADALKAGSNSGDASSQGKPTESVNVTSDSVPGWLPSSEERKQAPAVAQSFLAALDRGEYQQAYDLMTDLQRTDTKYDEFAKRLSAFNQMAGAVKERRITKVTWTKDPAQAPAPGIYAAIDLRSRFENVDRHCGYLMLYQPDPSTPFRVMRQEDNYMSNMDALKISEQKSAAEVERLWDQVSKNCPE